MAHSNRPRNQTSTRDLKQRVFTCLNKLSDRDTHSIAATELESIARTLTHDSLPMFLSCIHSTDSSDKSPVRKQCVRLLGFLSEAHKDALSPHLSKMLSNIVRRLRDPDNAVRMTCIDAVSTMSSQITKPPFASFVKPLTEALFTEQDHNSQIGAAMCLASAIEASPDPEPVMLRKLLPKFEKLLRSESFKAKPAVLVLIGSVVEAGGSSSHGALKNLVPCLMDFLSSEDWAARKAAAEALGKLAVAERDLLSEFKPSCLKVIENRRFDKVKVVRDTMNQTLETWKEVPDLSEEVSPPLQSQSSPQENASDGRYPPGSKGSCTGSSEAPLLRNKHITHSRSPPPDGSSATTARKRNPLKSNDRSTSPAMLQKLDHKKPSNWKIEVAVSHPPTLSGVYKDANKGRNENVAERREDEKTRSTKTETKRVLFTNNSDDKIYKFGGLRSGSRVVPCHEENFDSNAVVSNAAEDLSRNHKECEDISLIRKQLVQIENQQSSLLDLLQKFIGASQDGMNSLETRVHGLELALDEISYDLAVSNGRMTKTDPTGTTCCMLPGAEFLSSKFWRKTEGRYPTSRFSSAGDTPPISSRHHLADKNGNTETHKLETRRLRLHGGSGFIVNPLAEIHRHSRGISEVSSNKISKNGHGAASPVTDTSLANVMGRSYA